MLLSQREHENEQTLQPSNPDQGTGSSEFPCTELCCSAGSEILQPTTPAILKKTERCFSGSGTNARERSFVQSWYKQFPWIHLCCTKYKVYCFPCKNAYDSGAKVASSKADPAFTTVGFVTGRKLLNDSKSTSLHTDVETC